MKNTMQRYSPEVRFFAFPTKIWLFNLLFYQFVTLIEKSNFQYRAFLYAIRLAACLDFRLKNQDFLHNHPSFGPVLPTKS
jgi:hypothetical protein